MTTIYMIRHAEAEGNLYRIVQGQLNSYITPRGHRQIAALAERFKDVQLDALYSSDLRRTQTTAGAITKYHDLPMQLDKRLREIDLGVCEGMSFGDMYRFDPEQMDNFNNDPAQWRAEGAETFDECTRRILGVVTEIAQANDGKTVAVVSHGMVTRSLLAYLLNVKSRDIPSLPHGDNTAVSKLIYADGKFTVEYYNDNSHLPPELSTFARQSWWKKETRGADPNNLYYLPLDPNEEGRLYTELYAASWRAVHGDERGFDGQSFLASAKRHYAADKEHSLLKAYCSDGTLVGIVECDTQRAKDEGIGWVSLVYVGEDMRGRGLGTQLIGRAITNYQMLGRRAVRLHVSSENEKALRFYKNLGFETIGSEPAMLAPLYLLEKRFD